LPAVASPRWKPRPWRHREPRPNRGTTRNSNSMLSRSIMLSIFGVARLRPVKNSSRPPLPSGPDKMPRSFRLVFDLAQKLAIPRQGRRRPRRLGTRSGSGHPHRWQRLRSGGRDPQHPGYGGGSDPDVALKKRRLGERPSDRFGRVAFKD
jgi:hypothetical protein